MAFILSATVYGNNKMFFIEEMILLPTANFYRETKVIGKRILKKFVLTNLEYYVASLRDFNPVGNLENGLISEDT